MVDPGVTARHPMVMDHDSALGNVTGSSGKQALVVYPDNSNFGSNGSFGAISVGTSPVLACTSIVNKPGRFLLIFTPTNGDIFWGFSNTVTIATGTPVLKGLTAVFTTNDTVTIYLVATGTTDVRVVEA